MNAGEAVLFVLAFLGMIGGLLYLVDWTIKVVRTAIDTARGLTHKSEARAARRRLAERQQLVDAHPETD